jgi:hypothetical protein
MIMEKILKYNSGNISKVSSIKNTVEFFSAMKKNEILSFASKWMELENIILSKVSQDQKPKIVCSPSYADFRSRANTAM